MGGIGGGSDRWWLVDRKDRGGEKGAEGKAPLNRWCSGDQARGMDRKKGARKVKGGKGEGLGTDE